jgi:hypothetical protein
MAFLWLHLPVKTGMIPRKQGRSGPQPVKTSD